MKRFLIILVLIYVSKLLHAQIEQYNINGWHIAVVPSALINVWQGYQIKGEYGFKDKYGVNLNTGYLYGRKDDGLYNGLRLRASYRFYYQSTEREDDRLFTSVGYLHRRTSLKTQGNIIRSSGAYFERFRFKRRTVLNGIFFMVGSRTRLGKRFWTEGAFGLGYGSIKRSDNGVPENVQLAQTERQFFRFTNDPGVYPFGIIIANFTIGMNLQ